MTRHWTFGQRIAAGFAVTAVLAMLIGVVAIVALRNVVSSKDHVIDVNAQALASAQEIRAWAERKGGEGRAFLLTREERFLARMQDARNQFTQTAARLRQAAETDESRRLLETIVAAEEEHQRALEQVFALSRTGASVDAVSGA